MGLFRPYEQGKRPSTSRPGGATAAPRPGESAGRAVDAETPQPVPTEDAQAVQTEVAQQPAAGSRPADRTTTADSSPAAGGRHRSRRRGGATAAGAAPAPSEPTSEAVAPTEAATTSHRAEPQQPTKSRQPQKKGRPTPTRAEAEAARMARLHPVLTPKEQKRADREAERANRLGRMDAMERSPERQLARDYVDSRASMVSFVLPAMLLMMVLSIAFATNRVVAQVTTAGTFAIFIAFVVSVLLAWRGYKKEAAERGLGGNHRGMMMYLTNRMMTMRFMRRPEPQVARGEQY